MSKSFEEPQRQALLSVVVLFALNLRKLAQFVFAILAGSYFSKNISFGIGTAIGIGALLISVVSVLQFLRFKFHMKDGEFVLQKGVLKRERLVIPLERIQTVSLNQNLIQQIVGLTGVKIDTAGSTGEELAIRGLKKGDAKVLQALLESQKAQEEPEEDRFNLADHPAYESVKEKHTRKTLVQLSIGKLLTVGLTENHIRNGLVAVFFVGGLFNQFNDVLFDRLADEIESNKAAIESYFDSSDFVALLILAGLFLVGSVLISMVRTVLTYFDFKATLSEENIRLSSGLLKRQERSIPLSKIQIVRYSSNFLRKIPGFESVVILASRSGAQSTKSQATIPACYEDQKELLEEAIFPEHHLDTLFPFKPHPFYRLRKAVLYSIIPIAMGVVLGGKFGVIWGLILGGIALAYAQFLAYKHYQKTEIRTNGKFIRLGRGWAFTDRSSLLSYKIQSVEWRQSFFQRRRGTAHLRLFTAGGSLTLRYLPEQLAREIQNYVLYEVETSKKAWM